MGQQDMGPPFPLVRMWVSWISTVCVCVCVYSALLEREECFQDSQEEEFVQTILIPNWHWPWGFCLFHPIYTCTTSGQGLYPPLIYP